MIKKEINKNGQDSEYVFCRPCAEAYGLVPKKERSCPYSLAQKFSNCPWNTNNEIYSKHLAKLNRTMNDVSKNFATAEQEHLRGMVSEEVAQAYLAELGQR